MLKVLLKKQFAEIFRNYFYDPKKNRVRSRGGVIAMFALFCILIFGLIGGMFAMLSLSLCEGLATQGLGWLYFLVMGSLSVLLGTFGSVFNTYSTLYLAKDNDFLFSMPIPVRTILTARLLSVYLLGSVYALLVIAPASIVYWILSPGAAVVIGSILFSLLITLIVFLLSCALGYAVARISLKLKNKSVATLLVSIAFLVLYYVFYFRANDLIRLLIANAALYGERIRGSAYILYLFGAVGVGDPVAAAAFTAATALLCFLTLRLLSRSFIRIATSTGAARGKERRTREARQKSAGAALLSKEAGRFVSSANYMLNCGMAVLLLPACGIALLLKGPDILQALGGVFSGIPDAAAVMIASAICMVATMNSSAAPSVSLEGKSLWLVQSLPVKPFAVLLAKLRLQILLTLVPMVFCLICAVIRLRPGAAAGASLSAVCLIFGVFEAAFGLFWGVRMPNLAWTNETVPIKQSGSVMITTFTSWVFPILMGGGYLLFGHFIGAAAWMGIFCLAFAAAAAALILWLRGRGAEILSSL